MCRGRLDAACHPPLLVPLAAPGERFPVNDPGLQPRLEPRPADDAVFLQAGVCFWEMARNVQHARPDVPHGLLCAGLQPRG